jgi:predicted methyltransferase
MVGRGVGARCVPPSAAPSIRENPMIRFILAISLVLTLAACGQEPPPPPPPPPTPEPAVEVPPPSAEDIAEIKIDALLAGTHRAEGNAARDRYRNPRETLLFFGIRADSAVMELAPGAGWYTEILAPLVREEGRYIGVISDPEKAASERARDYFANTNQSLRDKLAEHPALYDRAELVEVDPAVPVFGAPGSVDLVLTFRNVHGWIRDGVAEATFQAAFDVLKPGGVLGVVQHRAPAGAEYAGSGYVSEEQVIALADAAGFVYAQSSEINANPADTKDHPSGVWTLPPSLRVGDEDPEKYLAIGESDRMTIRFIKPEKSDEVIDD